MGIHQKRKKRDQLRYWFDRYVETGVQGHLNRAAKLLTIFDIGYTKAVNGTKIKFSNFSEEKSCEENEQKQ